MPDQPSNNVAELFAPGPGERLRAARLSMGFDLAKIASELHLTGRVVEALEADDYDNVGARVFVRGYLRNYARIVGMPVESILRQFDEKWPDEAVRQTMVRQSPTLPADGGPSRGWAGAMTWLLVVGLVVLFLMWWRGYLDEIVPPQIRSTAVVDRPAPVAPNGDDLAAMPPLDSDPAFADGSLRLPAPPADVALDAEPGDSLSAAPPAPESSAAGGDDIAVSTPAPASGATLAVPPATPVMANDTQPLPTDGGAPVVEGTKQIVLTFNSACWVDVRDAERSFKLFGEMPKGTRKLLGGQPPYKMVIGNSQAVTITVNGKPFDLTPYAKGNVARFTLDP
ncbi:MAG: DUF4115 domain-containing protein [Chromatiaceae bacterium]|nr:DUF4115 domain-containing protein [Chromatiaceae bacterium]